MKKRKRLLAMLISLCMILPMLSNQYMFVSKAAENSIYVYSWNEEVGDRLNYFYEKYPDYEDNIVYVNLETVGTSDEYVQEVAELAGNQNSTCIVAYDAPVLSEQIANCSPLSDIGFDETKYSNAYPFTKEKGTYDGKLKALTMQASVGNIVYDADIAQEVLGTSDPEEVQKYLATPDKFIETAKKMKQNGYYMTSGVNQIDLENDGVSCMDEASRQACVDLYERILAGGYDSGNLAWGDGYFEDMINGNVFCFFSSTWHTVWTYGSAIEGSGINANICQGPFNYSWGGTYLTVYDHNKNDDIARLVLETLCCDTETMKAIETDTSDFVNNKVVNLDLSTNGAPLAMLANNQKPYSVWHSVAMNEPSINWISKYAENAIYLPTDTAYTANKNDMYDARFYAPTLSEDEEVIEEVRDSTGKLYKFNIPALSKARFEFSNFDDYIYFFDNLESALFNGFYESEDGNSYYYEFLNVEDSAKTYYVWLENQANDNKTYNVVIESLCADENSICVYSWNEEVGDRLNYFYEKYPAYKDKVKYVNLDMVGASEDYLTIAAGLARSDQNSTSIVAYDAPVVSEQIANSSPLSSIGFDETKYSNAYPFTKEKGTYDGKLKALTMQASVGNIVYDADIAQKVLGTSDPEEVQKYLATPDKFIETAKKMKQKGYYMTSGVNQIDLENDGVSCMDEASRQACVDLYERILAGGYDSGNLAWGDDYFEDMINGKVFCFFSSTWHTVWTYGSAIEGFGINANICQGPFNYSWGGTYLAVYDHNKNDDIARLVLETLCCDTETMKAIETDTSDFVNNKVVNLDLSTNGAPLAMLANNQKPYSVWHSVAMNEKPVFVTGVSLNKTSVSLEEAGTVTLTVTVTPNNAFDKDVTWTTNNSSVATVDANGKVTAKKAGKAVITATAKDGSGKKASCTVTVTAKQEQKPDPKPDPKPEVVSDVTVSYRTHVQSFGWQDYVTNGKLSGTSGKAKRLEGINIKVTGNKNLGIQYTTHCQSYGWLPWSANDEMNGTEGEAKRLEAIKIQLTGADKDKYDVYYRVHAQSYGWLGWAKNGAPAGTAGYAKRLEAIQVVIVKKGEKAPGLDYADVKASGGVHNASAYVAKAGTSPVVGGAATSAENPSIPGTDTTNVTYRTHVQSFGWQGWKYNGQMSGTSGMAKRLEGIEIKLTNKQYSGSIVYTTHVQSYGWQGDVNKPSTWKQEGKMAGTSGEAKRLEAICIQLTGEMEKHYDVYYRVHAQSYGWLGWAKNGECSGTAGYGKRLEGIQVVLVPKGGSAPADNYGGINANRTEAYIAK